LVIIWQLFFTGASTYSSNLYFDPQGAISFWTRLAVLFKTLSSIDGYDCFRYRTAQCAALLPHTCTNLQIQWAQHGFNEGSWHLALIHAASNLFFSALALLLHGFLG
jgi:hypothetical protein